MLVNNYKGIVGAKAACQIQAEKLAEWVTPQWEWSKFGTFFKGTSCVTEGIVRLVDDKVKFQNGFGAYGRVEVACHFDLKTKTVDAVFTR
jgi:hypothetical protein